MGDGDGVGVGVGTEATQSQGIPQTYVQFVGEAGDQTIYTTTNGQM